MKHLNFKYKERGITPGNELLRLSKLVAYSILTLSEIRSKEGSFIKSLPAGQHNFISRYSSIDSTIILLQHNMVPTEYFIF